MSSRTLYGLIVVALGAVGLSTLAPPVVAQVRAALVRDADHPARSSFLVTADVDLPGGTFNDEQLVAVIPTGKKLVLEFVTVNCSSGVDSRLQIFLRMRQPNGSLGRFIKIPVDSEPVPGNQSTMGWGAAEMVRLYADQHSEGSIEVTAGRFDSSGNVFCDVNLSGFTVDAQ